jgi:hypothetical protein
MYLLSWDFAMVYAGDREWLLLYKLGWKTHPRPRLEFRLDDRHPFSVSRPRVVRLREKDGPEVVVVSRLTQEGWLETRTMGLLRALPNVDSKVLVVDDELASVGSANCNNRSMGFDTECSIAIEARGGDRIRGLIASPRNRLPAECAGGSYDSGVCRFTQAQ